MPPPDIAKRFLDICDKHQGMLAVHCLAGLGRTGTLICMWIMKVSLALHSHLSESRAGWLPSAPSHLG